MASPKKPNRPEAWLTKQQMANALDVTVAFFDREVRRVACSEHIRRGSQGRLTFYAAGILKRWFNRASHAKVEAIEAYLDYELLNDAKLSVNLDD